MKLMLARLSADWQAHWGHPLALVETFVDPHLYQGTAYKASGWQRLGPTSGWKRSAEDFYVKHDRPKQIWVRELCPHACRQLRAPQLPPAWAPVAAQAAPRCTAKAAEVRSLIETLRAEVPEFRRKESLAYPRRWVAESPSGQEMVEWREFAIKLRGLCWPCFGLS